MQEYLGMLFRQQGLLLWSSAYTAGLLLLSLVLMTLDARLVTGVNPWLKPVKFEVSILIFNLTVAWLLTQLESPGWSARTISSVAAITMFIEITAIVIQAARGVPSHFNFSTPLNGVIFGTMGIAIAVNTLAITWLGLLYFQPQPQLAPAITWGVRLGIILFLLSCVQGFQMAGSGAHTVGAPDGGPGLPVAGWSTVAGDLRIAHFIGLHGLQLLPLLGYLLSRENRLAGTPIVTAAFAVVLALFCFTLMQAWAGRPLRIFSL